MEVCTLLSAFQLQVFQTVQNVVNNVVNLLANGTCSELHVKYEQVKSEQGRKEIAGESADAREDDR